jgi:hypothetical protein
MSLYINEMHILDMRFAANVSVAEFEQWLARIQHYFEHKQNFVLIMQTDVNTEFPEEYRAIQANGINNINKIFTNIAWVLLVLLKMKKIVFDWIHQLCTKLGMFHIL